MLGYIISDKETINVKEHKIQSFDILHKTDLNIFVVKNNKVLYKNYIIFNALKNGHVQVLEWFKNSGYEFKYNEWIIKYILEDAYSSFNVFEWFKNPDYKIKYNEYEDANIYTSKYGHVEILEWFKNSGYKLKYSKFVINCAFFDKNFKILEWFKNLNIKKVIKWLKAIKWLKSSKFKTKNNYIKGYNKN